jgi:uncharacterized Zn finger protein
MLVPIEQCEHTQEMICKHLVAWLQCNLDLREQIKRLRSQQPRLLIGKCLRAVK